MATIPDSCAIMAVDPGGTTGVAQAFLSPADAGSTAALMRRAVRKRALRVSQVVPCESPGLGGRADSAAQAQHLHQMWLNFVEHAYVELDILIPNILLVIEDFQLRQRSADLVPVEVTHGLLALLRGRDGTWAAMSLRPDDRIFFQQPAEAKTYATNERLRSWGVWSVGLEHGRDAVRHLCLRASKILDGEEA